MSTISITPKRVCDVFMYGLQFARLVTYYCLFVSLFVLLSIWILVV